MSHLLSLYYEHHNKVCMFPDYNHDKDAIKAVAQLGS